LKSSHHSGISSKLYEERLSNIWCNYPVLLSIRAFSENEAVEPGRFESWGQQRLIFLLAWHLIIREDVEMARIQVPRLQLSGGAHVKMLTGVGDLIPFEFFVD
jgi:hypothetical protein